MGEKIFKVESQNKLSLLIFLQENLQKKQTKTIQDQGEKQIKRIKNGVEKQLLDTDQKSNTSLF